MRQQIILFGASGNIGTQTLELLATDDTCELVAISVGENISRLKTILKQFPTIRYVWVKHHTDAVELQASNPLLMIVTGEEGITSILNAYPQATVVNAISGFAGLFATLATLQTQRKLLLANKESLVLAGTVVMGLVRTHNSQLIPIDSEHSAIFQCLEANNPISKIYLTASGGMFRNYSLAELRTIDDRLALQHPNWNMGQTITIDSSTMMNKAYEMIEAYHLFHHTPVEVLIHPQSIIHSMVEFCDYSIKALLSIPDMRQIIWYGLHYPRRIAQNLLQPLSFQKGCQLELMSADENRFQMLKLAAYCLQHSQYNSLTVGLNAINEVVRQQFIAGKIRFYEICERIETCFWELEMITLETYAEILSYNDKIKHNITKRYQ